MMEFSAWFTYFLLMTAIAYTPGPMTLFSMSSSVRNGFARTVPAIAGGSSAYIIQMAIVYLGLGAIVQSSMLVFGAIKWAGVVYLLVLGVKNWRKAVQQIDEPGKRAVSLKKQYWAGFLTGMSNPKSIIVFTALFPQFIDPARYTSDFLVLAVSFFFIQGSSAVSYALFGAQIFTWMHRKGIAHIQNRVTAVVLFVAGGMLAATEK